MIVVDFVADRRVRTLYAVQGKKLVDRDRVRRARIGLQPVKTISKEIRLVGVAQTPERGARIDFKKDLIHAPLSFLSAGAERGPALRRRHFFFKVLGPYLFERNEFRIGLGFRLRDRRMDAGVLHEMDERERDF